MDTATGKSSISLPLPLIGSQADAGAPVILNALPGRSVYPEGKIEVPEVKEGSRSVAEEELSRKEKQGQGTGKVMQQEGKNAGFKQQKPVQEKLEKGEVENDQQAMGQQEQQTQETEQGHVECPQGAHVEEMAQCECSQCVLQKQMQKLGRNMLADQVVGMEACTRSGVENPQCILGLGGRGQRGSRRRSVEAITGLMNMNDMGVPLTAAEGLGAFTGLGGKSCGVQLAFPGRFVEEVGGVVDIEDTGSLQKSGQKRQQETRRETRMHAQQQQQHVDMDQNLQKKCQQEAMNEQAQQQCQQDGTHTQAGLQAQYQSTLEGVYQ